MYREYWKLLEKPFENAPNPRFIYHSKKHDEALSRMLYVVREQKGGAVLTGEYGSGKTLLSRVLLKELSREQYKTALVFNPTLPPLELIKEIIYQLGRDASFLSSKIDLLHYLNDVLIRNRSENKSTVIMVDESQSLSEESFEELRLLLNFQLDESFLLSLILLGQPELRERINKMPQLRQRLAIRYHLIGLAADQVKAYVQHRLLVAGAQEEIFSEDSFGEIYRFSAGIPRRINNICDMALLVGYGEKKERITQEVIWKVAQDMEESPLETDLEEEALASG
ncbi:ExeA family protein [Candidatus Omnitrophota bacterium]